jgi:hypothetical protein
MTGKPLSKIYALIFIFLSGLASWAIATVGVNMDTMEMGALLNLFGPPMVGLASIILFLLIDWLLPHLRSTIFWDPDIITSKEGHAIVSFYTADTPGRYTILIEGCDMRGGIGSKRMGISISK